MTSSRQEKTALGFEVGSPIRKWTADDVNRVKRRPAEHEDDNEFSVTYHEIVESFGAVKATESTDDYQGDTVFAIENGGLFGFGEFGWGSCSGCDALEDACGDSAKIANVRNDIGGGIDWFRSLEDGIAYLKQHAEGRFAAELWSTLIEKLEAAPR